jgi:hypothetical protein
VPPLNNEDFRIVGAEPGERGNAIEFELRGAGQRFPIFFRSPDAVLEASNEAFLACALLPAMRLGVGLDLTGPLSKRFLNASPTILDIYTKWERSFKRVSFPELVPVDRTRAPSGRIATFFSGGVDSFYTLLKHRDEITDLILIHGMDIPYDNEEAWCRADASVQQVALEFGVSVTRIQTNLRTTLDPLVHWGPLAHGALMATVGHLLAPVFDRIYIPSTFSYAQIIPWGTSPLLDPLWSSEALEFVHDGCEADRPEKIAFIAESDTALRYLRICVKNVEGDYNCCRCEKCLSTMVVLEAFGKLAQCPTFDRPLDARSIRRLRLTKLELRFFEEKISLLKERAIRPDLQRAFKWAVLCGHFESQSHQLRRELRKPLRRLRRLVQSLQPTRST